MLLIVMRPNSAPIDHVTGKPVEHAEARISALIQQLEKSRSKIIIPAPALSELLVRAGSATQALIDTLQKSPVFQIKPFDTLAAIEVAAMTKQAIDSGNKRGGVDSTWAKVKYDRQIVAIAKVHRAKVIYSDDDDIHKHAKAVDIEVLRLIDIPAPLETAQLKLFAIGKNTTSEEMMSNE